MKGNNEQIDKLSKKCCKLSAREKRWMKRLHRRAKRRQGKNSNNPNPQHNRYAGWIG